MSQESNNRPAAEVRDAGMKIALFRNPPKQDGGRPWYSGRLTRSYRDANGEWKETDSLSGVDLLRAARLLEKAYDEEVGLRAADREAQPKPTA